MTSVLGPVSSTRRTIRPAQRVARPSFDEALRQKRESDYSAVETSLPMAQPRRGLARPADLGRFQGRLNELEKQLKTMLDGGQEKVVRGAQISNVLQLIEQLQASKRESGGTHD